MNPIEAGFTTRHDLRVFSHERNVKATRLDFSNQCLQYKSKHAENRRGFAGKILRSNQQGKEEIEPDEIEGYIAANLPFKRRQFITLEIVVIASSCRV